MNKRMKTTASLLAAANILGLFCVNSVAAEETKKGNNYIQGQLGMFFPIGDVEDADFDNGFNGAFSYGRYLTENLKVEGTLDMSGTDRDVSGANATAGRYSHEDVLGVSGVLVSLKGEYPVGQVDLFGGLGVGIYGISLVSEIDSQSLGSFDTDDCDTVFGAQASIGANYNLTKRFFLGVEGKYRWTDDAEISMKTAGIPITYEGDASGYSMAFTAGWRF